MAIHKDSRVVALVETIDDFLIKMLAEVGAKNPVVLALPEAENALEERGISYRRAKEYFPENMNVYEEAVGWLYDVTRREVCKKKSLEHYLIYERFSLWWCSWTYLYDVMLRVVSWIKLVTKAIEVHKPDVLLVLWKSPLLGDIASSVSQVMGLKCVTFPNIRTGGDVEYFPRLHLLLRLVLLSIKLVQRLALAKALKLYYVVTGRVRYPTQGSIILTSATVFLSRLGSEDFRSDIMMGRIAEELTKRGQDVKIVVRRHRPLPGLQTIIKHKAPFLPYEYYFSLSILIKTVSAAAKLERMLLELLHNDTFRNSLKYENVPLWPTLSEPFHIVFSDIFVGMIRHYETWLHIIKTERPKGIVVESEYSSLGMGAIAAGKECSVPSLAVQHGGVHPYNPGYVRTPKATKAGPEELSLCPIADRTAVFGEYVREILIERGGYPPNRVVATGQPRFDTILEDASGFKEEDIRHRFGLLYRRRVILCTMHAFQTKYGYPDYDREFLSMMLEAVRDLRDVQLVVKLHPIEDGEMERELVEASGMTDVVITSEGLYGLLSICDVVVTISSTVGVEAAILNKPIIVVNLTRQPDTMPYVEEGIAVGVYREGDLRDALVRMLEDNDLKNQLRKNRENFLRRHVYAVDGKAASRIADVASALFQ